MNMKMLQGIDDGSVRVAVRKINDFKFLLGGIVLTLILGMAGFSRVFPDFNALTWLYMTIQLFLLDPQSFDVSDTLRGTDANTSAIPWTLEVARWMAATITCYGIIFATWRLLQKSSGALKIQKLRGHIIVFGSGPTVTGLLDECQANKSNCVLLAPCHDLVEDWRAQGGLAVEINSAAEQNPLNREHLRRSGLEQASAFYAFDEHDGNNLRAAMLAENFNTTARIIVRQDEPYTCELLQRNGLLSPAKGSLLRVISVAFTRARILLRDVPLEWHPQKGLATEVHLIIPELRTFEKAVVIQAALIGHYHGGKRVTLWLKSSESHGSLLNDFPGITRCVDLRLIGENGINSIQDISREAIDGALVTIMATHLLPEDGYLQTLRFRERWSPKNSFRIVLSGPLADGEAIVTGADDLVVATQLKGLATPDSLDEHDMVAKKIH
ncbi:NAD-binding protein, partial [Akkermansiaceae bacterium]|nr:NAD-binding protein [Akkermansiaceae bacterium]